MDKLPYQAYVSLLSGRFEWDPDKDHRNKAKHGVEFSRAQRAFDDPLRVFIEDHKHSTPAERRYFCMGRVDGGVLMVRFTCRNLVVRIFGAGYWSIGRRIYEKRNQIHAGPERR